jgi:fermentation-respiration switch protein FrsA (DUF1100 family)
MDEKFQRINFYSDGLKITGILFMPEGVESCPGIVLPQGTVGLKEHYRSPVICSMLADAGFAALTFDYRGFGESEGPKDQPRTQIVPLEQVEDIRNALTFLAAQPGVDANRLALFGFCWGGSHSVYVGAIDSRVKCVAEVGGIGDGTRWLRTVRQYWEWREFIKRIEADRIKRVMTGSSETVRFGEILIGSPMAKEGRRRIVEEIAPASPPYHTPDATLQTAERIMEYRPEEVVARLSPRPLLIMHGDADDLTPFEEAESLYKRGGDPKRLVVLPGAYHHDVYLDPLFWDVMKIAIDWFRQWLIPAEGKASGSQERLPLIRKGGEKGFRIRRIKTKVQNNLRRRGNL